VWLASWIVPRHAREQWKRKWRVEIFHWAMFLSEPGRGSRAARRDLFRHCWLSFPDALWQRYDRDDFLRTWDRKVRTRKFCLVAEAVLLLAVIVASGFLPQLRSFLRPLPYADGQQIGTVAYLGTMAAMRTSVPRQWLHAWATDSKTVEAVAEYRFARRVLSIGTNVRVAGIGLVSPNFFRTLGVSAWLGRTFDDADKNSCANCVVLSHDYWSEDLHRDRSVVGRTIAVNGLQYKVIGILPERFWFLSRGAALWQIAADSDDFSFDGMRKLVGGVVRVKPGYTYAAVNLDFQHVLRDETGLYREIEVTALDRRGLQLVYPYLFVCLALLAAAVVIAYQRYRECARELKRGPNLAWWSFLVGKTALLLITVALACMEVIPFLSRTSAQPFDPSVWPISIWVCLVLSVAVVMWSTYDQRYRCHTCLARLGLPVMVGDHGRLLLSHGGTEFVCPHGHGILLVSDMSTSWIEPEQWSRFDESWDALFSVTPPTSAR
jgi:hypothetical protein